jgi:hypothetical protein
MASGPWRQPPWEELPGEEVRWPGWELGLELELELEVGVGLRGRGRDSRPEPECAPIALGQYLQERVLKQERGLKWEATSAAARKLFGELRTEEVLEEARSALDLV